MAKLRAGWERMLYYGTAGSTAATLIDNHVADIDINNQHEYVETTSRGDGSAPPQKTEQLVCRACGLSWKMQYDDSDSHVAALLAACRTGTPKAIKIIRHLGGETEFDGDCYLDDDAPGPLKGGMEITFTGRPTKDAGRGWTVG
jgi:hypothetical protein